MGRHGPDPDYDPRDDRSYGSGNVFNGNTRLVMWILGIFGGVMTVLMSLVLQAVYNTNGDMHELKGQVAALQGIVAGLAREDAHGNRQ